MRTWNYKININQYLGDESLPEGERAALAIRALQAGRYCFPQPSLVGQLLDGMREAAQAEDWDGFDEHLDQVYNLADRARIWLGL